MYEPKSELDVNEYFTSPNPLSSKQKTLAGSITLLAIVARLVSSYLTWVTWHQSPIAGCSGGSLADCDEVLTSAWSKWLGIPVSLFGMIVYVGILAICWPAVSQKSSWAATGLMALALLAAGSGVWFFGVQVFLLGQFCFYCLSVHICGLLISVISYFALQNSDVVQNYDQMRALLGVQEETPEPVESAEIASYQTLVAAGLATLGLLVLMGGQLLFAPAGMEFIANAENAEIVSDEQAEADNTVEEEPEFRVDFDTKDDETEPTTPETKTESADLRPARSSEPRFISLQALGNRVEVTNEPTLGDPHAEQVLVELMDYTCPHCRKVALVHPSGY